MINMKKIIILGVEHKNSAGFLRHFSSSGYEVFAASSKILVPEFFSRFNDNIIILPKSGYIENYGKGKFRDSAQMEKFLSKLKDVLKENNIDYILSLSETTLPILSKKIDRLSVKNPYPEYETMRKLHDKKRLIEELKNFNCSSFSIPKVYKDEVDFPCVVRPSKGMESNCVFICKDKEELIKAKNNIKSREFDVLVQNLIPSFERISFNLLINRDGEIVRALIPKKISEEKIKGTLSEIEDFFDKINYFGFASPQFLIYKNKLFLTEINPRLSSYYYGLDFGVEFPEGWKKLFIEEKNVEKRIKFKEKIPRFFESSNIYLKKSNDSIPVLGRFIHFWQDTFKNYIK